MIFKIISYRHLMANHLSHFIDPKVKPNSICKKGKNTQNQNICLIMIL